MAFTISSALRMVLTQTPKNIQTGGVDFTPRQVRSESPGTGKSPNDPWRFVAGKILPSTGIPSCCVAI